jgi:hypothetical protein
MMLLASKNFSITLRRRDFTRDLSADRNSRCSNVLISYGKHCYADPSVDEV